MWTEIYFNTKKSSIMESKLTQDLEFEPKRNKRSYFTTKGLLNSNYKRIVKYNFKKMSKKSIFGKRQRAKHPELCRSGHVMSVILKLSIFAIALTAWF